MTWFISGVIAAIPFIPWMKIWIVVLNWFNKTFPEAKKDIEFKIKQAQLSWLKYEHVMLVFFISFGLLISSWFFNLTGWWQYIFIAMFALPWYFIKWWGNHVKDVVRSELANFYRAFRQLLISGAHPDRALEASMEHVTYLKKPLQNILNNWGDPVGTKETLQHIYELYYDSEIKNLINLLESVLLNYKDEITLQTMESQESLIRELREHAEVTKDEVETERLEMLSTLIILAQVFLVILPIVMDTVSQINQLSQ